MSRFSDEVHHCVAPHPSSILSIQPALRPAVVPRRSHAPLTRDRSRFIDVQRFNEEVAISLDTPDDTLASRDNFNEV